LSGPDPRVDEALRPFVKHWPGKAWDEDWSLYWLPMGFSNKKGSDTDPRFRLIFDRLIALVMKDGGKRQYTFFDTQLVHPHLTEHFVLKAIDYLPLGVAGYVPGSEPTRFPRYDDVKNVDAKLAYDKMMEKKEDFRMHDVFPHAPKMLHFIMADQEMARQNLMGRGGFTYFISKLPPADFTNLTKQMMAEFTKDPLMLEIPMVVPLFNSASFTAGSAAHMKRWYPMLDLYVGESPDDKGIIIASNRCLDEQLAEYAESAGMRPSRRRSLWGRR